MSVSLWVSAHSYPSGPVHPHDACTPPPIPTLPVASHCARHTSHLNFRTPTHHVTTALGPSGCTFSSHRSSTTAPSNPSDFNSLVTSRPVMQPQGIDMGTHTHRLSRTQTLITQISYLCQEIRDIKRQNKNRSISTPKAEPRKGATLNTVQEEKTMDSNQCQDRTNIDGTDGSSCTYSSRSTPPPHSEHSHDIPSHHETSHPSQFSTPPQSNQGQPAARSFPPPDNTQLSISSSPAASYPEAPSSASDTLIGIVAGNKRDQNPQKGGRLLSESESDSDCKSRVGMEGEGERGLVCGGGIGLGDEH